MVDGGDEVYVRVEGQKGENGLCFGYAEGRRVDVVDDEVELDVGGGGGEKVIDPLCAFVDCRSGRIELVDVRDVLDGVEDVFQGRLWLKAVDDDDMAVH